jgi:Fic-DOC domain mobile mystery protein B
MGLDLTYGYGETPLDEDEKDGLLVNVTTKQELDELEQRNIEEAIRWTLYRRKRFTDKEILTEAFVKLLHQKMFGDVWAWAGTFRKTDKNLGVDKYQIGIALKALLDDCQFWIAHKTFPGDEIAIRFKHRIVSIHCFANGNGRHSRLIADIIIEKIFRKEVFSWGSNNTTQHEASRTKYLNALHTADRGTFEPLVTFARS